MLINLEALKKTYTPAVLGYVIFLAVVVGALSSELDGPAVLEKRKKPTFAIPLIGICTFPSSFHFFPTCQMTTKSTCVGTKRAYVHLIERASWTWPTFSI